MQPAPSLMHLEPPAETQRADVLLIILGLASIALHLLCGGGYGYFRDELYAIACSKHLAWGYVDQPPLSEGILAIVGKLLGYSQLALRLLPALCGGVITFFVGRIARALGGGRFAQALAAVAYLAGGVYLAIDNYYSMNCFDHLFWIINIYLLVRILNGADTRWWLLFGLVAGLGLENKYSMGFLGLGLIAGLTLTRARRHFLDKWLWVGGALAVLLFLPHFLWEVRNHFPTAEFIHNVTLKKNLPLSPWGFFLQCVLLMNPTALPVWAAGLVYLLWDPPPKPVPGSAVTEMSATASAPASLASGRRLRTLGWTFIGVLAILLSTNSKPYYAAPAFLILLPAGAVAEERLLSRPHCNWLKPAYLVLLILGGALFAPLVLPVLAPPTLARYQTWLGIQVGSEERGDSPRNLPQVLGDRLGWPELTAQVAEIYHSLPPEEQAQCVIGASNYGYAGAIDLFGPRYGLPNAISTHNNYWFWGPGSKPGAVLLVVGGSQRDYERLYADVQPVATFTFPYAYISGTRIFLCRRPKMTLQEYWPTHHDFI